MCRATRIPAAEGGYADARGGAPSALQQGGTGWYDPHPSQNKSPAGVLPTEVVLMLCCCCVSVRWRPAGLCSETWSKRCSVSTAPMEAEFQRPITDRRRAGTANHRPKGEDYIRLLLHDGSQTQRRLPPLLHQMAS